MFTYILDFWPPLSHKIEVLNKTEDISALKINGTIIRGVGIMPLRIMFRTKIPGILKEI